MRARRIGVSRGRARRRLRLLLGIGATLALVGLAVAVYASPLLGVRTIEVTGTDEATGDQIVEVLDDARGTPVLRLDRAELTGRVRELPGMADARLSVTWSGHMAVAVSDDRPAAYVPTTDARAAIVGRTGRVLSMANEAPADLVRVEAAVEPSVGGAVPAPVLPAVEVAAALPPDLVAVTSGVGVTDAGVVLELANGAEATVGSTSDLNRKLNSVSTLLSGHVELACLAAIDVSEPAMATLSRDPACTGAPV
jgi:cell division protein FtsQ